MFKQEKLKNTIIYILPSILFAVILIISSNTDSQDIDSICIYACVVMSFLLGFNEKKSGLLAFLLAPFICMFTNILLIIYNPETKYEDAYLIIGMYLIFFLIFFVSAIILKINLRLSKKTKVYLVPVIAIVIFLIFNLGFLENNIANPFKRIYEKQLAYSYINEKYKDMSDYKITKLDYSFFWFEGQDIPTFKVYFAVQNSKDKYFTVNGEAPLFSAKITYDSYENVTNGLNTTIRICSEYKYEVNNKIKTILTENFRYPTLHPSLNINVNEADLSIFKYNDEDESRTDLLGKEIISTAVIDKEYNIYELGKEAGIIRISIKDNDTSMENAIQKIIEIKKILDKENIGFSKLYFYIQDENTDRSKDLFLKINSSDIVNNKDDIIKNIELLSTLEGNFVFSQSIE